MDEWKINPHLLEAWLWHTPRGLDDECKATLAGFPGIRPMTTNLQ
ncbi:hypothetical protein ACPOL_5821 [Acidisarcina polymorpha]|uniref:Uncharacterized protein n=1 Tax=Acidisarcina polymorpha TaxID=2211140 RepID=A0A2Z5G8S9_9BACT|nr:hypothetical protein ACPOL_5821 [Acidisarcina polymorpha]